MITTARVRRAGWVVMTTLGTGVALYSARYFSLNPATFIPPQIATYLAHLGPLLLHVGGGVLALSLGPWQFWGGLRARRPVLHRLIGRVYVAAVLAVGTGGLLLAPLSLGGPMAHLGFGAMAVALLFTTGMAFTSILRRRIPSHRAWMMRSYAVIFSAVTFRVWLGMLAAAHLPVLGEGYAVGSWTSWLIDLLVAEMLIRRLAGVRAARSNRPAQTAELISTPWSEGPEAHRAAV
jgi:uncharacterized membrane protein